MIKKGFPIFAFFLLCSTAFAQWPSFTLRNYHYSDFKQQTSPYFSMLSSQISVHPFVLRSADSRFNAGMNLSGFNPYSDIGKVGLRPGLLPSLEGTIIVTSNLAFHGTISGLTHATGLVWIQGWGFRLFLTDDPGKDWSISAKFSRLDNVGNYRLSSIDMILEKEWQLSSFHFRTGLGSNSFKSKIFIDGDEIPSFIRGSDTYATFGVIFQYNKFLLCPELYLSQEGVQLSLGLHRVFH